MRDTLLQKPLADALLFLHSGNGAGDANLFLHSGNGAGDAKLRVAEGSAGYRRS